MIKLKLLIMSVMICIAAIIQAQISGVVTSGSDGSGLPGVSIVVKGTSTGTVTDIDGKYSIDASEGSTIVFSYVGFTTKEVSVGNQKVIDVILAESAEALDEIVVTALGIRKEAKKLGYATSTISKELVAENKSSNFMNTLQGKIAGVNISSLGTGPGGTSKIRIRGQSSIGGQNNPLIVINGVPIDNTNFGYNPGNAGADNSIGLRGGGTTSDGGDGLSSINPDDIESMTVLKGATAAALYGSRAKDGVIMITTKTKGDVKTKGIGVTFNSNYTNDTPLDFTDYQYEYGQGENGVRPQAANPTSGQWSFGEKFAPGMTQVLFDNQTVPYEPQYDRIRKFFRNGQNFANTITMSSNGDKGGFNLSFNNTNNLGIVPNNKFGRKILNLGFSYELSKSLSISGSANYSKENNTNPPNIANQDNSIPTSLYNLSNSMPLSLMEAKKFNAQGNEFIYSRFMNRTNPYFTLSEQFNNIIRDRLFGNVSVKYNITDWLSVQGRVGQDYWSRDQAYNNFPTGQASLAAAPAGFVNGQFTQESRRFRETNADILISASREFGDFGIDLTAGGNQMTRRADQNNVFVQDFVVRGLYTVANARVKDPIYSLSERAVNSVYGSAEVSYKRFLYINGTVRNDWFSTLSPANRSILYPSISGSFVFSEALGNGLPSWITFGKLRAAYAEVGSDTDVNPYANNLFYGVNANLFPNPAGAPQPLGGSSGNTLPNANLRPMRASEKEVGLELKLFNNRIGLDLALYQKLTDDQIVSAQISDGSGFTNTLINSGRSRTNGIEGLINLTPIKAGNFQWDITVNGAYNKTRVLKLLTETPGERITVGTHVFNGELRQVVGQEMGQIYGFGYRRDAQGRKVFGGNGVALRTADLISFGSALPKWTGGFNNGFTYKDISFSFLIDFKLGNMMLSGTNFNLTRHGLHKQTLAGRDGIVGEGVNDKGEPNTVKANIQPYWEVVRSLALVEPIIYNGGYWKLRQITAGYDLTKLLPATFPVKGLKLSFVANNVLMLKKWIPNIDPESFGYSSDNLVGLESTGLPTTRSIGFNLNVKF